MIPKEVFLSHSDSDRPFAISIFSVLQQHGLPVWYSRINIVGAQQWHDEIGAALERCDWFTIILSPNSVASMWVKRELFYALNQPRFQNCIVPILYLPCNPDQLSWTLSSFQHVDFTQSFEEGCRQLLRVWGVEYQGN